MVAVDWATTVLPLAILVVVALGIAVWPVLARVFSSSRAGRHASHILDVGGADMSPEDQVRSRNQHPGAGGFG